LYCTRRLFARSRLAPRTVLLRHRDFRPSGVLASCVGPGPGAEAYVAFLHQSPLLTRFQKQPSKLRRYCSSALSRHLLTCSLCSSLWKSYFRRCRGYSSRSRFSPRRYHHRQRIALSRRQPTAALAACNHTSDSRFVSSSLPRKGTHHPRAPPCPCI
jgi:hypothetical protein